MMRESFALQETIRWHQSHSTFPTRVKKLKEVAAKSGGLDKYFQDALGLAQLVDEETRQKDDVIAIADKNGKVLRMVKTSKKDSGSGAA